jgi:formate dehydrogenase subunit gamma
MNPQQTKEAPLLVRRYSGSARINHWITAISFVLLAVSGLSLFDPTFYGLSALFGGGANVRWMHPWIGLIFALGFLGLFLRFFTANLPGRGDGAWLAGLRHVLSGHDEYLPEMGKYNAGQKMVFWAMVILVPTMLVTGLALWEPGLAWVEAQTGYMTTIDQKRLAAVLHASAAVLMIVIWIVHVYAAIWVRGTIRGMTRGAVTGGWGWRHHRRWLRDEVSRGEGRVPKQAAE